MFLFLFFLQFSVAQHFNFDDLFGPQPRYSGQKVAIKSDYLKDYEYWKNSVGTLLPGLTHERFKYYVEKRLDLENDFKAWILADDHQEALDQKMQSILGAVIRQTFAKSEDLQTAKAAIDKLTQFWMKKPLSKNDSIAAIFHESNLRIKYRSIYPEFERDFGWYAKQFYDELFRLNHYENAPPKKLNFEQFNFEFESLYDFVAQLALSPIVTTPFSFREVVYQGSQLHIVGPSEKFDRQTFMKMKTLIDVKSNVPIFTNGHRYWVISDSQKFYTNNQLIEQLGAILSKNGNDISIHTTEIISLEMLISPTDVFYNVLTQMRRVIFDLNHSIAMNQQILNVQLSRLLDKNFFNESAELLVDQLLINNFKFYALSFYSPKMDQLQLPDWTLPLQQQALKFFARLEGPRIQSRTLPYAASILSSRKTIQRPAKFKPRQQRSVEAGNPQGQTLIKNFSRSEQQDLKKQILFQIEQGDQPIRFLAFMPEGQPPLDKIENNLEVLKPSHHARLHVLPFYLNQNDSLHIPTPLDFKAHAADGEDYQILVSETGNVSVKKPLVPQTSLSIDFVPTKTVKEFFSPTVDLEWLKFVITQLQDAGFKKLSDRLKVRQPESIFEIEKIVRETARYSFDAQLETQFFKSNPLQSLKTFLDSKGVAQYQCTAAAQLLLFILQNSVAAMSGLEFKIVSGFRVQGSFISAWDAHAVVGLFLYGKLILTLDSTPRQVAEPLQSKAIESVQQNPILKSFFDLKPDSSHPLVRLLKVAGDLQRGVSILDKSSLKKILEYQIYLIEKIEQNSDPEPKFQKLKEPQYLLLAYSLTKALEEALESMSEEPCVEALRSAI